MRRFLCFTYAFRLKLDLRDPEHLTARKVKYASALRSCRSFGINRIFKRGPMFSLKHRLGSLGNPYYEKCIGKT